MSPMTWIFVARSPLLVLAIGAALATSAHALDVELIWFVTRPLSSQVDWQRPQSDNANRFMRQTYVLAELAQRAYQTTAPGRAVDQLGFREQAYITERVRLKPHEIGERLAFGPRLGIVGRQATLNQTVTATALVARSEDRRVRVVAVRGTVLDGPGDIATDLNAATLSANGVDVHYGFGVHAGLLLRRVQRELGAACGRGGERVWLTGHSLGGVSATILAYWLETAGCHVDGVMTFGAPAPGEASFARAYRARGLDALTHRWENARDPVPCLPLGGAWRRVGTRHAIAHGHIRLHARGGSCSESLRGTTPQFLQMVYLLSAIQMPFEDWIRRELCDAHVTPERVIFAVLSLGASEAVCHALDELNNLKVTFEQVTGLVTFAAFRGIDMKPHRIATGYQRPFFNVEARTRSGAYCEPVWRTRMDAIETTDCP